MSDQHTPPADGDSEFPTLTGESEHDDDTMALFGLTPRQARFCEEYVIDPCGKRAAIGAGYSPATAEQQASRLLRNVKVQQRIAELRMQIGYRSSMCADILIAKLETVYCRALQAKRFQAAERAVELQARIAGLYLMPTRLLRWPTARQRRDESLRITDEELGLAADGPDRDTVRRDT